LNALVNIDNGREVAFDGESSGGAVNYLKQLCLRENDRGQIEIQRNPGIVLNWYGSIVTDFYISHHSNKSQRLINELIGQLSARNQTFDENPLTVDQFGELIDLVQNGTVTG
jgi:aspartyl-tRNA(Asn)/glutamyl-tRNA(Gln) amidotransferase subunit B